MVMTVRGQMMKLMNLVLVHSHCLELDLNFHVSKPMSTFRLTEVHRE